MSSIDVNLYRSQDSRILKVEFVSDFKKSYEYAVLTFKCDEQKLEAISTSKGTIDNEGNVRLIEKKAEIYVEYSTLSNKLECLVGYYVQNDLLDYEALTALFENDQQISPTSVSVPYLKTVPGSFKSRLDDFLEALERRKSQWKIDISCPDDLIMKITSSGRDSTMVSFGEDSVEITAADYLFRLDPQVSRIVIPREVIERQHPKYQPQCKLGIFEIIEPDFMGVKGVFYKSRISNLLTMADIAK